MAFLTETLNEVDQVPPGVARLGNPAGHLRNIIPADTAITFPIVGGDYANQPAGTSNPLATGPLFRWELWEMFSGTLVDSATASSGGHVIAAGPGATWHTDGLPAGAYHWIGHAEDSIATWGTFRGDSTFIVYADDTGLPDPQWDVGATGLAGRDDFAMLARIGIPFTRLTVKLHETKNVGTEQAPVIVSTEPDFHASNEATIALMDAVGYTGPRMLTFADFRIGDGAAVTTILQHARYATLTHAEPTNEPKPNLEPEGGYITAGFVPTQQAFHGAVKAADPTLLVCTAGSVQVGPTGVANGIIPALAAGLANWYDVLTWHTYPGGQGDVSSHRTRTTAPAQDGYYGALEKALADYDQAHPGANTKTRPRLISEAGTYMAAQYGAGVPLLQAVDIATEYRLVAQHGVQQHQCAWFYGRSHGFPGFASWLETLTFTNYGAGPIVNIYPGALLMMARSVQLRDAGSAGGHRPWLAALEFGPDDPCMIGNLYGGSDGTRLLDLQAVGLRTLDVTFALAGTVPSTVVFVNHAGTASTLPVTAGQVVVPVSLYGAYVRLPAGCTATVVNAPAWDPPGDIEATTNGSVGVTGMSSVLGGVYKSALVYDGPNGDTIRSNWRRLEPMPTGVGGPQSLTLALPEPRAARQYRAHCPPAWHGQCVILQAQVLDGGGNVRAVIDEMAQLKIRAHVSLAFNSWYVAYWDGAHAFDLDLGDDALTSVVLSVTRTTRGGSPTLDTSTGYGQQPIDPSLDELVLGAGLSTPGRLTLQRVSLRTEDADTSPPPSGDVRYVVLAPS